MSTETPQVVLTIPSAVATHVLGESSIIIGAGDLSVLTHSTALAAPSAPGPSGKVNAPILTLTIGQAAFPLFKTTTFGTLAGDERAYVFTPEIGGEQGGYVKVTLPEGVLDSTSTLAELQTKFEEILIQNNLLKPNTGAPAEEGAKKESNKAAEDVWASTSA